MKQKSAEKGKNLKARKKEKTLQAATCKVKFGCGVQTMA